MTISKAQWEAVTEELERLNRAVQDLQADLHYLKYRRIPDLERRTEHGTNHDNH